MSAKFIYFDIGNVLLSFSNERACRQLADLTGVDWQHYWKLIFTDNLHLAFESGEITPRQFYDQLCQAVDRRPDFEAFALAISDIFNIQATVKPIVAHLAEAGYPLGLLSNTNELHWNWYTSGRYELLPGAFSVHALSFQLHALKPHREIYDAAARLAGVAPEEIFFVDDMPANVAGARAAGFDAVPFTTASDLADALHRRGIRFNY